MKLAAKVAAVSVLLITGCLAQQQERPMKTIHDIEVQTISGENISLGQYKGKALLIVNTASKCGFTGQYDGLQKLYESYKDKGFVVLGFPSNDFLRQEPGTNEEIQAFCKLNYGVTFPMFAKVSVKGDNQHPLYRNLTSEAAHPGFGGKISWNFNKFLVSPSGQIVARFGSRTKPSDPALIKAIEANLPQ